MDNRFIDNLKHQAEENPMVALGIAAALITSVSKLINSGTTAANARAWKMEVARRAMKDAAKFKK